VKKALVVFGLLGLAAGCTPYDPQAKKALFAPEETPYTLAFVFDPNCAGLYDGRSPLKYAMEVKDTYFRDRSESSDRLVIAQVSKNNAGVLWDGKPRTFKREFPNAAEDLKAFLLRNGDSCKDVSAYDAVADTFEYLLEHRAATGKTAVLVFSSLENRSADPAASRARLVESLSAFSNSNGHCAFYWLTKETSKELKAVGKEAGLKFVSFIPDPVRDPVRPTFLD